MQKLHTFYMHLLATVFGILIYFMPTLKASKSHLTLINIIYDNIRNLLTQVIQNITNFLNFFMTIFIMKLMDFLILGELNIEQINVNCLLNDDCISATFVTVVYKPYY